MFGKSVALFSALALTALPARAQGLDSASQEGIKRDGISHGRSETGGGSYGDQDRGGSRSFYGYPRHRSVDGRGGATLDRRSVSGLSAGTSPYRSNRHGSAYYGRNYGAPYFGGYYDQGVYYRERRD
jgi:hypothetical protein